MSDNNIERLEPTRTAIQLFLDGIINGDLGESATISLSNEKPGPHIHARNARVRMAFEYSDGLQTDEDKRLSSTIAGLIDKINLKLNDTDQRSAVSWGEGRYTVYIRPENIEAFVEAANAIVAPKAHDIDHTSLSKLMTDAQENGVKLSPESFPKLNVNGHELPVQSVFPKGNVKDEDTEQHLFSNFDGVITSNPRPSDYYQVFYRVADDCDIAIEVKKDEPSHYVSGWNAGETREIEGAKDSSEPDVGHIQEVEGERLIDSFSRFVSNHEITKGYVAQHLAPSSVAPSTQEGVMKVSGPPAREKGPEGRRS